VVALTLAIALPGLATLSPSTFNAGDGNLTVQGSETDWATPAPNLQKGIDKPTGQNDDSFGQGTKEDTAVPTVVSGQIPNNKSDLTRFYVANEKVGGKEFLYLAWERSRSRTAPPTWTSSSTRTPRRARTGSPPSALQETS